MLIVVESGLRGVISLRAVPELIVLEKGEAIFQSPHYLPIKGCVPRPLFLRVLVSGTPTWRKVHGVRREQDGD